VLIDAGMSHAGENHLIEHETGEPHGAVFLCERNGGEVSASRSELEELRAEMLLMGCVNDALV
jgi:hypothetical protein